MPRDFYGWRPYVSVAQRRAAAQREMARLKKTGVDIQPVEIGGRTIAGTFWGKAWCDHMEAQGDFTNRLPRGRTYVRNGSVCHLAIEKGKIEAKVSGSEIYGITIRIDVLPAGKWKKVKQRCSGQIGTLLELLQGRISDSVMAVVTDPESGLFPRPGEIHLDCDCPDYAHLCKHLAAVLYGVGARLDTRPELLFLLRGVDHADLVTATSDEAVSRATGRGGRRRKVADSDLSDVFGIDLDNEEAVQSDSQPSSHQTAQRKKRQPKRAKKTAKRRTVKSAESRPSRQSAADVEPKPRRKKKAARATGKKKTTTPADTAATVKKSVKKKSVKKSAAKKSAKKKSAKRTDGTITKKTSTTGAARQTPAKKGKRKTGLRKKTQ